jgi:hypothetical protein
MDNVTGPISLRLAGWRRGGDQGEAGSAWAVLDDAAWEQGVLRNVLFDNIRARVPAVFMEGTPYEGMKPDIARYEGEKRSCIQVHGTPKTTIENIRFSNMHVSFPGGGTAEEAARRDIPELERRYPEIYMFGILPAYGLYARHVRGLSLHDVRFDLASEDRRPAVVCNAVRDLEIKEFGAVGHPQMESLVRLEGCRGAWIRASRPLSEVAAFVGTERMSADEITLTGNDLRLAAHPLRRK